MSLSWESWRAQWDGCRKCPIGERAHRHVLGYGNLAAKILMIGEAPGRSEDVVGKPFVGRSGKLLDKMFDQVGHVRESMFTTNLVACRPCDDRTADNRQPEGEEIINCRPRLVQVLELVSPRAVILVGRPAQQWGQVMLRELKWRGPILLLTHPAYFLRLGGPKAPGYEKAIRDLKKFLTDYN